MNAVVPDSALKLFGMLRTFGIAYRNYPHNPVLTCADKIDVELPAPHTKNLFLKDDKGKFWLISAVEDSRVEMKTVAKTIGVKSLRFASEESLLEHLGVKPGAVTMFAMVNDVNKKVTPLLDERILENEFACFHPLHNEATAVIDSKDVLKLIENLGRQCRVLKRSEMASEV